MVEYKDVYNCARANLGLSLEQFKKIVKTPEHPETLRDEFAKFALQGILTNNKYESDVSIVKAAYKFADLILKERLK